MVSLTTKDLPIQDVGIHIHPYTNSSALNRHGSATLFVSGEEIYLIDHTNRKYIDAVSGLWSVNLGYSCKQVIQAIKEQASRLPFGSTHAWSTNEPATLLVSKLLDLSENYFAGVALANSGSESIELANYTAKKYWQSLGFNNKKKILCLEGGYHGSTLLTRSLSYHGSDNLKKQLGVHSIQITNQNGQKKIDKMLVDLIDDKITEIGADNISFLIMETIQLRNGVIVPEDDFFLRLATVLNKHKILLVLDESVTGIGRTGSWYGFQNFHALPNMVILSKGLSSGYQPISALLMDKTIHSAIVNSESLFAAGFSTSGHPIACSSALATLKEIESTSLIQRLIDKKIPFFEGLCQSLYDLSSVKHIRSYGLLAAIDFGNDMKSQDLAKSVKNKCFKDGLIIRNSGSSVLLCPPLITSNIEMEKIFDTLKRNLKQ